jgi:hypothetical protein
VADGLDITMSGMSHASEVITLAYENRWRVSEEPVEILDTDYSKSKGQPLLNGVNIVFDGLLRGRISDELDPGAADRGGARAARVPAALAGQRTVEGMGEGRLRAVRRRRDLRHRSTGRHDGRRELGWCGPRYRSDEHVLIIAFAFTTLWTYMRFKDIELKYARLARAVALHNARMPEER